MKRIQHYIVITILLPSLASCMAAAERKSVAYYKKNKAAIESIRGNYELLYRHQAFSGGFSDMSHKYVVMEVTTDTLRSIFDSKYDRPQLFDMISRFNYDTTRLQSLVATMRQVKCLWVGKASFYVKGIKDTITFLSFKSALVDKPFVENKYYVLLFLERPIDDPEINENIKKGKFVKVDELVYFTIGSGYR